jgi:hypothetical protein
VGGEIPPLSILGEIMATGRRRQSDAKKKTDKKPDSEKKESKQGKKPAAQEVSMRRK